MADCTFKDLLRCIRFAALLPSLPFITLFVQHRVLNKLKSQANKDIKNCRTLCSFFFSPWLESIFLLRSENRLSLRLTDSVRVCVCLSLSCLGYKIQVLNL